MSGSKNITLVGARGYVGRELVALIEASPDYSLVMATSREHQGKHLSEVFDDTSSDIVFSESSPAIVAASGADAVVLGLPNGLAAPYVEALEQVSPETVIVDLSSDYRHKDGWVYGLSDLLPDHVKGATRIANPGCYATAGILALYPLRGRIDGVPSVFGISGYSGAGTSPSDKNNPDRLRDNVLPYGFAGHLHQAEMSAAIGTPVRFMPHVVSFFRGLITSVTVPLQSGVTLDDVHAAYEAAYRGSQSVRVQAAPPEPQDVAGTPNAVIGGMAIDPATNVLAVSCAHDNLLKGAASQAMANLRLAFA